MALLPPQPGQLPLPLAVLLRLWRQSPALPLFGPRALLLGLLRLPLNPLIPSRAERHPVAPLHEASRQIVQPGLVLAPDAGHGHASAAAGGARRIPHTFLAKPFAGCGHEPVQLVGHARIESALAPRCGYQLFLPLLPGVVAFALVQYLHRQLGYPDARPRLLRTVLRRRHASPRKTAKARLTVTMVASSR